MGLFLDKTRPEETFLFQGVLLNVSVKNNKRVLHSRVQLKSQNKKISLRIPLFIRKS